MLLNNSFLGDVSLKGVDIKVNYINIVLYNIVIIKHYCCLLTVNKRLEKNKFKVIYKYIININIIF